MTKNLNGIRILNTRPSEQGKQLSQMIAAAGGQSIDLPALVIEPTSFKWLDNLPPLNMVKQSIFISANAANYFCKALKQYNILWPNHIQVTTIGSSSAAVLEQQGIRVDHIPAISESEHLLSLPNLQDITHQTILLIKGEEGREVIAKTVQARGAQLISLNVYRRIMPQYDKQIMHSLWKEDSLDIILFTSQHAMKNIFALFGEQAAPWLRSKPCLVISERLAQAAKKMGMSTVIVSRPEAILDTLIRAC